jgi:hypothetical protein
MEGAPTIFSPLPTDLLRILEKGIYINFPPPGFDPRNASPQDLDKFFLPPRPDSVRAPHAFANWYRAMSPPLIFPDNQQDLRELFALGPFRSRHREQGTSSLSEESSRNWSGGYVRPRNFDKMALVQGSWTAPQPAAPPGAGDGTYASSVWVGLDGHDPASRSMPQIGTGQYVNLAQGIATNTVFAWWQWWQWGDLSTIQMPILSVPVNAGDTIYAQVHAVGINTAQFFIKNVSTGDCFPFAFVPQAPPPIGINAIAPRIEGRTAEWIVERPTKPGTNQRFTLANYHQATFWDCNAATDGGSGLQEFQFQREVLIRMNDWDDLTQPGTLISSPRRTGDDAMDVTYI